MALGSEGIGVAHDPGDDRHPRLPVSVRPRAMLLQDQRALGVTSRHLRHLFSKSCSPAIGLVVNSRRIRDPTTISRPVMEVPDNRR